MADRTGLTEWAPINDAIERCRDMLDPTLVVDWENCPAQCSADLALIARYFAMNTTDLAQLRKDAANCHDFIRATVEMLMAIHDSPTPAKIRNIIDNLQSLTLSQGT